MKTGAREDFCAFVTSLRWPDLPEEVRARVLLTAIDDLASMISGARARSARIAAAYAAELFAAGPATLVADPRHLTAEAAGFANAVAANAYDVDDVSLYSWGHPGAQVFPAALALAEASGTCGARLLTGLVVGYEVAARAGLCMYADVPAAPGRDYRGCAAWGAPSVAGVAAHLLGLDAEQAWQAIGIAEYHSPHAPILRDVAYPGMVKHGHGPGVLAGMMAARLARAGFTAPSSTIGDERFSALIVDAGLTYRMLGSGVDWKRFACCSWVHPALDALEGLLERTAVRPEFVSRVIVEAHHDSRLLGTALPATTEEAQFNMAWPLAAMIAEGEVGPRQVADDRMDDPVIRDLAGRVELHESAELDRLYWLSEKGLPGGAQGARVVVELSDGRVLDSGVVLQATQQDRPWSLAEMRDKFRWATKHVLSPERAEELLAVGERLPELDDVRELTSLLSERRP